MSGFGWSVCEHGAELSFSPPAVYSDKNRALVFTGLAIEGVLGMLKIQVSLSSSSGSFDKWGLVFSALEERKDAT